MTDAGADSPARVLVVARAESAPEINRWLAAVPGYATAATLSDPAADLRPLVASTRADVVILERALSEELVFRLLDDLRPSSTAGLVILVEDSDPKWERRAFRAGALEVLRAPLDGGAADTLAEVVREVRRRRSSVGPPSPLAAPAPPTTSAPRPPADPAAPLIAVVSAKGGVGRSFVAANLASVVGQKRRVALCDLDLQFSDLSTWGVERAPERTIDHLAAVVAAGELQLADVQAVAVNRFGGVSVLPGTRSPVEGATWASERGVRALRLVAALRKWFDLVLVDDLPGLLEPVVGIARSASLLVVVTTCEVGALRATRRYVELLDRYAPTPRIIVANRSNRGLAAKLVRAALGERERIEFLKEDRTFARRLVVEGLAAAGQRGRGVSRTFRRLGDTISLATAAAPRGGG